MGPGHPEAASRLVAIEAALEQAGLMARLERELAAEVPRAALLRVHTRDYLQRLEDWSPRGEGRVMLDPDTFMNAATLPAALRAAGAAVQAVDALLAGRARAAFCAVRPPGHHAGRDFAMGFCVLNNVAVGAAHALAQGLARVAIVDFDLHHGNGTEDIFRNEPRVLLVSSFQHPYYPGSGADTQSDHILPLPLPAGSGGLAFRTVWDTRGLPALDRFAPEMVFFSAGFDAHRDDPLGGLVLVEDDFAWLTREVARLAMRHAQGRMVSLLEGGYALRALGASAAAHVAELLNAAS